MFWFRGASVSKLDSPRAERMMEKGAPSREFFLGPAMWKAAGRRARHGRQFLGVSAYDSLLSRGLHRTVSNLRAEQPKGPKLTSVWSFPFHSELHGPESGVSLMVISGCLGRFIFTLITGRTCLRDIWGGVRGQGWGGVGSSSKKGLTFLLD